MAGPLGKESALGGPSVPSKVKALVFMLVLLLTSAVGTLCVNGLLMPLLLFRPRLYRLLFDLFIGLWEWQASVSASRMYFDMFSLPVCFCKP